MNPTAQPRSLGKDSALPKAPVGYTKGPFQCPWYSAPTVGQTRGAGGGVEKHRWFGDSPTVAKSPEMPTPGLGAEPRASFLWERCCYCTGPLFC